MMKIKNNIVGEHKGQYLLEGPFVEVLLKAPNLLYEKGTNSS